MDLGRNTLGSATTFKKAFVGRYVHLGMEYYKVFPFSVARENFAEENLTR